MQQVVSFRMRKLVVVVIFTMKITCSVYLPKEHPGVGLIDDSERIKTNSKGNQEMETKDNRAMRSEDFKDDGDISWYLRIFGRKVMIWSCKNAIQSIVQDENSAPFLDLSCNVIGKIWSITWHHGNQEIASYIGKFGKVIEPRRYSLSVSSHVDRRGHRFSRWNDIRLRIHNASSDVDSGLYRFSVSHWDGPIQQHKIFVDLTETKHHKSRKHEMLQDFGNSGIQDLVDQ